MDSARPGRAKLSGVERARLAGRRPLAPVAVPVLVALVLCCVELARPGVLFGVYAYDDGVYFGAAVRLVHGVLPYRDFVLVQPPGIVVLLSPVALLSRLVGTDAGLAAARCLTALVTLADVALLGRLLAPRGRVASSVAAGALALFPLAVAADNTVLLAPYVALFCILGGLAAFPGGQLAPPRRLLIAGALFGLGASVKLTAGLAGVALVLVALGARKVRSAAATAAGAAAAFVVVAAPFASVAPGTFVHDVVGVQLDRASTGSRTVPVGERLAALTGVSGLPGLHGSVAVSAAIAAVAVVGGLTCLVLARRHLGLLEAFLGLAGVVEVAAVFWSSEFFSYYTYLPALFLAALAGACAGHLRAHLAPAVPTALRALPVFGAVVVLAAGAVLAGDVVHAGRYLAASDVRSPQVLVDAAVAPGACVVADNPALTLAADRFNPAPGGAGRSCPALDDPFGAWLSADPADPPPARGTPPPGLVAHWRTWLAESDYVLLTAPLSDFVPWTPGLRTFFSDHEALIGHARGVYLYLNTAQRAP